jgi:hypothetical protein
MMMRAERSCFTPRMGPKPGFQPPMVGLYSVVRMLHRVVARPGQDLVEDSWIGARLVGHHLGRLTAVRLDEAHTFCDILDALRAIEPATG